MTEQRSRFPPGPAGRSSRSSTGSGDSSAHTRCSEPGAGAAGTHLLRNSARASPRASSSTVSSWPPRTAGPTFTGSARGLDGAELRLSLRRSSTVPVTLVLDGAEELDDVNGLRDVAVEARRQKPLLSSLHRLRGDGEHWDRGGSPVHSQTAERLNAVDVRQLDVHQHESGTCSAANSTARTPAALGGALPRRQRLRASVARGGRAPEGGGRFVTPDDRSERCKREEGAGNRWRGSPAPRRDDLASRGTGIGTFVRRAGSLATEQQDGTRPPCCSRPVHVPALAVDERSDV